ncbi:arsenate reductase (glutaredoxin) [Roseovarius spongiae]|uniref:Arsenate reductase (Glutaredoxin) n=1 Tax=Roseovarius spongiae TaxID=2320272 RepID=A0A3A8B4H9_9RHOB|nr:ArsC/Spx/MgsR family protein [Roseovarius spongiae]RKF16591.1 arsenate reductase (glutaredoxin) [Roseovarius spongiae]
MITYWHNPRCSKSRAGLALLEERGADVAPRRYLEDAPDEAELRKVQALLDRPVADMLRADAAKRLAGQDDDALLAAMTRDPALIERPIAFTALAAVIGRPPEEVLRLL